jgi:hypothetical protein
MTRKNIFLVITLLVMELTVIQAQESNEGIIFPGTSLAEKLVWLQRSADSHNTYVVVVNANENIDPHTLEYPGAINITIVLRGDNANRTIRLRSHGTMLTIRRDVTLILSNNIILQGHGGNNNSMITVDGGTLIMNAGSSITGNTTANSGGGVLVINGGTFTLNDGTISNNTANQNGGGVDVNNGTFIMNGGIISGNTARRNGGGVGVNGGQTFTMRSGTITDNTSIEHAGGVYIYLPSLSSVNFSKIGGIITGYNSDQNNGNVVRDDNGILARRGHAIWADVSNLRKETTAGEGDNMSSRVSGSAGGWDN